MSWTDCLTLFDARFAWAMAAAGLAGFVRGYSGFGAALMFIPLAGMLYDPKAAVVILWIIDGIGTVPFLAPHLRRARWSEVIPLLIGSTIAMPVGVWILSHGDPVALRWAICGTVLLSTAALASGWRYRGKPALSAALAVGGLAGFGNGAVGIGGPPMVLFWLAGQSNVSQARSNIFAYFAMTTVTALGLYFWYGIFTLNLLVLGLALTPIYGAALFFGDQLFRRTGETGFRRAAFLLCGAAGILGLPLWQ